MANVPNIRRVLETSGATYAFIDGVAAMGANLDAPMPMVNDPATVGVRPAPNAVALLIQAGTECRRFPPARIQAIKLVREALGLGLKESKDIIDSFCPPAPYPG